MSRRAKFFQLLASEDINSNQMYLGMTVLASLRGGHIDNFAGAVFDHNETILSQGRALHWESGRSTSIGRVEGVFMLADSCKLASTIYFHESNEEEYSKHAPGRWWGACGVLG